MAVLKQYVLSTNIELICCYKVVTTLKTVIYEIFLVIHFDNRKKRVTFNPEKKKAAKK